MREVVDDEIEGYYAEFALACHVPLPALATTAHDLGRAFT
jgi:hypothetical protein